LRPGRGRLGLGRRYDEEKRTKGERDPAHLPRRSTQNAKG
jgi:hypothetical protein